MATVNANLVARAMGNRDNDFITLETAFARVTIAREHNEAGGAVFFLGDDANTAHASLLDAVAGALEALAEYTAGRMD